MTKTILAVRDLLKEFEVGRHRVLTAVNNVSFTVDEGETLALVGESGSGKTTVGRCILRVLEPTDGAIELDGTDVTHLGPTEMRSHRQRLQVVFQDPYDSLNPRKTIDWIVSEPLREHLHLDGEEIRIRTRGLLRRVGLGEEVEDRYPHHLTAGQQQRVAIARSIALDPDLVVLDEPTSALDPISRESIIGLLRALQARLGMAFLFISHDLVTVRHMSHRIAVMYLGEIVEEGPIEEVFEDPAHPYTMALLASAPSVDRALSSTPHVVLSGEIPSPIDLPTGCFLASRCPFALDECRAGRPSLDPIGDERRSRCFRMTGALPPISEEEMHMRDPVVDPQEPGATSSLVRPQEGKV